MGIYLSKVLPYLVYPLSIALGFATLGLLFLLFRKIKTGAVLVLLSAGTLLIFSTPLVAYRLLGAIEMRYEPVPVSTAEKVDAIVVLAGALHLPFSPRLDFELREGSDRYRHAARLYLAGVAPRIVVSGGNVFDPGPGIESEAFYIRSLLGEWGVPRDAIVIEERSRNTFENAAMTRPILSDAGIKRVALVTSAAHMPRAFAVFKAQGLDAIPMPTDFIVEAYNSVSLLNLLPSAEALYLSTAAIHEHLGLFVYRWRGWAD